MISDRSREGTTPAARAGRKPRARGGGSGPPGKRDGALSSHLAVISGDGTAPPAAPEPEPVPGHPGWSYRPGGGPVWRASKHGPLQVLAWSPRVTERLVVTGDSGKPAGRYYALQVGEDTLTVAHADLVRGEVWEWFPDATGTGATATRQALVSIVEAEAAKCPRTRVVDRTGWHVCPDGGRVYVHADGRTYPPGGGLRIVGMPEQLAQAALPPARAASDAEIRAALGAARAAGVPLLLSIGAAARSLGHSLRPALVSVCFVGEPGAGKTSAAHAGRMLSIDGTWPPVATASFADTLTAIERHVNREGDVLALLDDLALAGDASEVEQRDANLKLERVLRAAGNGASMRDRSSRDLTDRPGSRVRGIVAVTAQRLPATMQPSLYRRLVVVPMARGEVDTAWLRKHGAELAGPLRTVGERIIAHLHAAGELAGPAVKRLAEALAEQVARMADREAATENLAEAAGEIVRKALFDGHAHIRTQDREVDPATIPGREPQALGLNERPDGSWRVKGPALYWLPNHGECGGLGVRTEDLAMLFQASRDPRVRGLGRNSLAAALLKMGALVPSKQKGKAASHQVKIAGERERLILLRPEVVFPNDDAPIGPLSPEGGTGGTGGTAQVNGSQAAPAPEVGGDALTRAVPPAEVGGDALTGEVPPVPPVPASQTWEGDDGGSDVRARPRGAGALQVHAGRGEGASRNGGPAGEAGAALRREHGGVRAGRGAWVQGASGGPGDAESGSRLTLDGMPASASMASAFGWAFADAPVGACWVCDGPCHTRGPDGRPVHPLCWGKQPSTPAAAAGEQLELADAGEEDQAVTATEHPRPEPHPEPRPGPRVPAALDAAGLHLPDGRVLPVADRSTGAAVAAAAAGAGARDVWLHPEVTRALGLEPARLQAQATGSPWLAPAGEWHPTQDRLTAMAVYRHGAEHEVTRLHVVTPEGRLGSLAGARDGAELLRLVLRFEELTGARWDGSASQTTAHLRRALVRGAKGMSPGSYNPAELLPEPLARGVARAPSWYRPLTPAEAARYPYVVLVDQRPNYLAGRDSELGAKAPAH